MPYTLGSKKRDLMQKVVKREVEFSTSGKHERSDYAVAGWRREKKGSAVYHGPPTGKTA